MILKRALGAFALLTLLVLGLAACGDDGGGDDEESTDDSVAETTEDTQEEFDAGGDDEEEEDEGEDNSEEQSTFADDVTEQVTGEISVPEGEPYSGFSLVFNDDESLEASFPDEWEVDGTPDEIVIPGAPLLLGAEDVDEYFNSWEVSGAEVRLWAEGGTDTEAGVNELAAGYENQCEMQPVEDLELEDDFYFGHVIVGLDCGGTETDFVSIAADRDGTGGLVLVNVQITNTADLEALEEVLATFAVTQPG